MGVLGKTLFCEAAVHSGLCLGFYALGTPTSLLCNLKHLQILEGNMPGHHHMEVCLLYMNMSCLPTGCLCQCELGIANDVICGW